MKKLIKILLALAVFAIGFGLACYMLAEKTAPKYIKISGNSENDLLTEE